MCAKYVTRARGGALSVAFAGALVFGALATAKAADRSVDWVRQMNVAVRGDSVQKTAGCQGCDDAGAMSRQVIRGNGYVEFSPGEANTFMVAGLTHEGAGAKFGEIDFAFRFNGAGAADVVEDGAYQSGGDTRYVAGDRFRIAVVNDRVQYLKNGRLLHESTRVASYPLAFDVALGTVGATVQQARINTDVGSFDWYSRQYPYGYNEGVATNGQTLYLNSQRGWTNTGIYVYAGDRIAIDSSPGGRFIARVGDSRPIALNGNGVIVRAPASGYLFLGVNEPSWADRGDYLVDVTIN